MCGTASLPAAVPAAVSPTKCWSSAIQHSKRDEAHESEEESHAERGPGRRDEHEEGEERDRARVADGLERRQLVQDQEQEEPHQGVEDALREVRDVHHRGERRERHEKARARQPSGPAGCAGLEAPRGRQERSHQERPARAEEVGHVERQHAVRDEGIEREPQDDRQRHRGASRLMRISRRPSAAEAEPAPRPGGV